MNNIRLNEEIVNYIMKNIKLYTIPNNKQFNKIKYVLPKQKRIVAIGDIHSDFIALYKCLLKAKVINKNGEWIGKNTYVVQIGDILDGGGRGNKELDFIGEEFFIIEYLNYLDKEAKKKGGRVIRLLGNHELMNIFEPNTRYLTKNSIKMFGSLENRINSLKYNKNGCFRLIHNSSVLLRIGDWLFVHGGLLPHHLSGKYKKMNYNNSIDDINNKFYNIFNTNNSCIDCDLLFYDNDSIFYNRVYSNDEDNKYAKQCMNKVKRKLNIKGMVVGHSVQHNINKKNDVWRIDIGLSKSFNKKNNYNVLEILDNHKVNII